MSLYNKTIQIRLSETEKKRIVHEMESEGYHNLSRWIRKKLVPDEMRYGKKESYPKQAMGYQTPGMNQEGNSCEEIHESIPTQRFKNRSPNMETLPGNLEGSRGGNIDIYREDLAKYFPLDFQKTKGPK